MLASFFNQIDLEVMALVVSLITMGLVPYLISKNTRQHFRGVSERSEQTEILLSIKDKQGIIEKKVDSTLASVVQLQTQRLEDKSEFLKLYERVINHERETKRGNRFDNKD